MKKIGRQTALLEIKPVIRSCAAVVGKREGDCALGGGFDYVSDDSYFGQETWEKAESEMIRKCFTLCCKKADLNPAGLDCVLSGDLLNQCVASTFALRDTPVPYLGLYGACSTMAESLVLTSMLIDAGFAKNACALTGSHFCSAERQYRFPLEYGGCKPPTAQCTVTGSGAVILSDRGEGTKIDACTVGHIEDAGITDANNMGAAMAPAAFATLKAHFIDSGRGPDYYDAIFTGDLGAVGHDILEALMKDEGFELGRKYADCGVLIFSGSDNKDQKPGSGCGCSASVLCGHILPEMRRGRWKRVLFAATGALMSPVTSQQKESIPGICHAVSLESGV